MIIQVDMLTIEPFPVYADMCIIVTTRTLNFFMTRFLTTFFKNLLGNHVRKPGHMLAQQYGVFHNFSCFPSTLSPILTKLNYQICAGSLFSLYVVTP